MRRTPRHYDIEFKQRAAQMVLDGRGPTEVARDLDITLSCLRRWKKDLLEKMDQGGAPAGDGAAPMDDVAGADIVDPGMGENTPDDDGGGMAG